MTIPARRNPDPERFRVRLESAPNVTEQDGGWVYEATAQAYNRVNDRLMIFSQGSGQKTIAERVPAGRVKIHDGHPFVASASDVVGKVLSAQESAAGVVYKGFLSASHEALATKLSEGVVDENSLEVMILREGLREVPLDQVPQIARPFVSLTPEGLANVREVHEWMWLAIGLVGSSSQGLAAIIEPPTWVPYQDLPLSSSAGPWDAEAAYNRVAAWAHAGRENRPGEATAMLSRAFLARGPIKDGEPSFLLQIADVEEGQLVVSLAALEAAWTDLEERLENAASSAAHSTLLAAARTLGRYEARLGNLTSDANPVHTTPEQDVGPPGAPATPPAEAAPTQPATSTPAGPDSPPTVLGEGHGDLEAQGARREFLRGLESDIADLELPKEGAQDDTASPGRQSLPAGTQ